MEMTEKASCGGRAFPFDLEGSPQVLTKEAVLQGCLGIWLFSRITPATVLACRGEADPDRCSCRHSWCFQDTSKPFLCLLLRKNAQTLPLAVGSLVITLYCGDAR